MTMVPVTYLKQNLYDHRSQAMSWWTGCFVLDCRVCHSCLCDGRREITRGVCNLSQVVPLMAKEKDPAEGLTV